MDIKKFVNLCPHDIDFQFADGKRVIFPRSGIVARVSTVSKEVESIFLEREGMLIPVGITTYGDIVGLPAPEEGVGYIVSQLVIDHVGDRGDVFAPGTGPSDGAIRFPNGHPQAGQIDAVTRLIMAPPAE